ncbi:MAG: helix-turn-helix transcriptional regulator [Solirubrobacterales bacterium]
MVTREYPGELAEQFGRNLKRARRRVGFSQEELASVCNMHRTAIGLLENGDRLPRLDTIIKVASGASIEPATLLDGMGWYVGMGHAGGFFVS